MAHKAALKLDNHKVKKSAFGFLKREEAQITTYMETIFDVAECKVGDVSLKMAKFG